MKDKDTSPGIDSCANDDPFGYRGKRFDFEEMLRSSKLHVDSIMFFAGRLQGQLLHTDSLMPKHQTPTEIWNAQLLVKRMAELKSTLERMLPLIEDWAESDVSILGRGSQTS